MQLSKIILSFKKDYKIIISRSLLINLIKKRQSINYWAACGPASHVFGSIFSPSLPIWGILAQYVSQIGFAAKVNRNPCTDLVLIQHE